MRKKKDTHSFDFRPLGLAIREAREKAGLSNPTEHDTEAAIKVGVEALRILIAQDREKKA